MSLAYVFILCFTVGYGLYMLYRNDYVLRYRMATLKDPSRSHEERYARYKKLPEYETMLFWQPFRWDWSEYLEK